MRYVKTLLICLSLIIFNATASPSHVPQNAMKQLQQLAGSWKMTVESTNDNGKTWMASPTQNVNITLKHNGMVLEEKPSESDKAMFKMLTYITYDQYRGVYRKAAIDDVWGIMDLYEGKIVDNKLILDNLTSKTFFPISKDVWRGFRLTADLSLTGNSRQMLIEKTDDNGQSWQPAFRATYIKS